MNDIFDGIDFSSLDDAFGVAFDEYGLVKSFLNGDAPGTDELKNILSESLFGAAKGLLPCVLSIVSLVLFGFGVSVLRPEGKTGGVADAVVAVSVAGIGVAAFAKIVIETKKTVSALRKGVEAFFPIILTLTAAGGGKTTAAVFQPVAGVAVAGIDVVADKILIPLTVAMTVVGCCGAFSKTIKLKKTSELFKSLFKWTIGLGGTVFCFFVTVKGFAAASYDGFSLKAVKYAVSSGLPQAGQFVSNGVDLVCVASTLIKNSFGIVASIGVLYAVASPVVRAFVASIAMKFAQAVGEGTEGVSNALGAISDGLNCLAVTTLAAGISFVVLILPIVCLAGGV